MAQVC